MLKAKARVPSAPDTHVLKVLMEEYLEMLRDTERGVKEVLSLDLQKEEFWDELAELDPTITLIEARSKGIQEEVLDLIDQLPED